MSSFSGGGTGQTRETRGFRLPGALFAVSLLLLLFTFPGAGSGATASLPAASHSFPWSGAEFSHAHGTAGFPASRGLGSSSLGPGYVAETLDLVNQTILPGNFVATPNFPGVVAFAPSTSQVWAGGNVLSWTPANGTFVAGTISPSNSTISQGFLMAPTSGTLYSSQWYQDTVAVVNVTTHSIAKEIPVGNDPTWLALDPGRSELFVANYASNNVTVINTSTNTVSANISLPNYPYGMAFDPADNTTLVSIFGNGYVEVINDSSRSLVSRIGLPSSYTYGSEPTGIAYDPTNDTMLVGEYGPDAIATIDATNGSYVSTSSAVGAVDSLAFDNATGQVFASTTSSLEVLHGNLTKLATIPEAGGTFGFDPASGRMYFANGDGRFWQLNTSADTLGKFFPTGGPDPDGITYDNATGAALTADFDEPQVSVVNLSDANTSEIPIANSSPFGILSDPFDGKVFVSDSGVFGPPAVRNLYVLNGTPPYALNQTITVGGGPLGLALNSNGTLLAVANANSNTVSLLTSSGTQTTVRVGSYPFAVAYSKATAQFYVANDYSNNVSVINATSGRVTATIGVCGSPEGAAYDPLDQQVLVSCSGTGQVEELNTSSHNVSRTLTVGSEPGPIAYDPFTQTLLVANSGADNVSVIEASTGNLSDSIAVAVDPSGIAVNPNNGTVYVTDYGSDSISVIEPCPRVSCLSLGAFSATPDPIALGNTTNLAATVEYSVGPTSFRYSGLPPGCTSANSSLLACMPTVPGNFTVEVNATDTTGTSVHLSTNLTVLPPPAPTIASLVVSPAAPLVDAVMNVTVHATNGLPPLSYAYSGLPPGCSTANTSTLSCAPSMAGNFTIVVTVTDALGRGTNDSRHVAVGWEAGPPVVGSLTVSPAFPVVNESMNLTLSASGGWGWLEYSYSGLPSGCASANLSSLSCTPTALGTYLVNGTVADAEGRTASHQIDVRVVDAPPAIQSFGANPDPATVGSAVDLTVVATGGEVPLTYSYTGLPGTCSGATGATPICTPSSAATFPIVVTVTDVLGRSSESRLSLTVSALPAASRPEIGSFSADPNPVVAGSPTVLTVTAKAGRPPYVVSYAGLPTGCVSENATELRCTPESSGNYTITVRVDDTNGQTANASLLLDVMENSSTLPVVLAPTKAAAVPWLEYGTLAAVAAVALAVVALLLRRRGPPPSEAAVDAPEEPAETRSAEDEIGPADPS